MRRLFPPRAGVVDEGNNGNMNPRDPGLFPLFPPVHMYTRNGNTPRPQSKPDPVSPNLHARTAPPQGGEEMSTNPLIPTGLPAWLAPFAEEVAAWGPAPVARGCWVVGCRRDAHLHGLCKTHHRRAKRAWDPTPADARYDKRPLREEQSVVPTSAQETTARPNPMEEP